MKKCILMAAAVSSLTACAANQLSNKDIAVAAKVAVFKEYNSSAVKQYFKKDYIQNSAHLASGIKPVSEILPKLKETKINYQTHRILQDDNMVVLHNSYTNAQALGAKEIIRFDIFRIEDGKVAEHWDIVNEIPTKLPHNNGLF